MPKSPLLLPSMYNAQIVTRFASTIFYILLFSYSFRRFHQFLRRRALKKELGCQIPIQYDHQDPLGIDLFRLDMKWFNEECRLPKKKLLFDRYGRTFESHFLRSKTIWTIDPENIKAIHSTDYQSFGFAPIRHAALKPFMGSSMFTSDGEIWANARAQVTPIFHRAQISDLSNFMSYVERFITKIPQDGRTFDISTLIFDLFLDTSFEQLFGQPANARATDTSLDSQAFLKAYYKAQKGAGRRIMLGWFRNMVPDPAFREGCEMINSLADKQIDASRKRQALLSTDSKESQELGSKHVFLDELVKTGADQATIRGILMSAFTAAHESGAIQTENVLFLAARALPQVWNKIRNEANTLDGKQLTLQNLRGLSYIRAVVDEANRLYPVIGFNSRAALRDTVLPRGGGADGKAPIFVAKHTPVITFPFGLHRDPDVFGPDSEQFRPERWLPGQAVLSGTDENQLDQHQTLRPAWSYIPFGGGPRRCPAQERAIIETIAVIVRLAQKFESIRNRDDRGWQEKAGLVSRNRNGCKIALKLARKAIE